MNTTSNTHNSKANSIQNLLPLKAICRTFGGDIPGQVVSDLGTDEQGRHYVQFAPDPEMKAKGFAEGPVLTDQIEPASTRGAALWYATAYGSPVFPVHSVNAKGVCTCSEGANCAKRPGKHPRTKNGLTDATTDLQTIRAWWKKWPSANVGVATGAGAGFFVVDVDPDKGGKKSLSDLERQHEKLPETKTALTGGGGLHHLFKHPGVKIKNSESELGPGLDIRGDGGYIVAAPSKHVSGNYYHWRDGAPIVCAPDWLVNLLTKAEEKQKPSAANGQYATWDALRAELGRRIGAHATAKKNKTGNIDCRAICHNGEGATGLFYNPSTNQAHCNAKCDQETILRAFGLPDAPTSKKAPKATSNSNGNDAGQSTFATVGNVIFKRTDEGVYAVNDDGDKHWVCSPLSIEADTRNEDGEAWGRLLVVTDRDGTRHEWAMPMTMLAGDGRDYREKLLDLGLSIGAGRGSRQMLELYLHTKPEKRVRCVDRAGWQDEVYVFPDATLGGADGERIYLQSQAGNNHLIKTAGTLKEWQDKIAGYCLNNSMLMFAVSAAFAAPLLRQLQCESGGFNFWGNTSEGKSTLLHAAGSVWGGHSDKGYLRRWRATANALETVAKLHNDALLCLDELKECDPRAVELAVYMLSNGQGKIRRQKTDALRPIDEWQLLYLSSGELTLADHLASAGKRVFGGQEVRFIDLRADAGKGHGIFNDLHHFKNGKEFSEHIQQSAKRYYGTAIRAFLSELINQRRVNQARVWYRDYQAKFAKDYLPKDAKPEVARSFDRFALVAFAGELASEYGVTTWPKHEATHAAGTVFQHWIEARGTVGQSDEEQAIAIVRGFLEKHGGSRFQKRNNPTKDTDAEADDLEIGTPRTIINRAGYVDINAKGEIDFYYIFLEQFRTEVCVGFNSGIVLNALKARGFLKSGSDRPQIQIRGVAEGKPYVYAISARIFG
jgi:uncharacterized protein (DUF927 family)